MSWVVRCYYGSGDYEATASSFYTPPLKRGFEHVRQVGPMLRDELVSIMPQQEKFLLSYLRSNTPPHVLETLASCGWDARVYGLGERPRRRTHFVPSRSTNNDLSMILKPVARHLV